VHCARASQLSDQDAADVAAALGGQGWTGAAAGRPVGALATRVSMMASAPSRFGLAGARCVLPWQHASAPWHRASSAPCGLPRPCSVCSAWSVLVAPALGTLRQAPGQRIQLEQQRDRMLALQQRARTLQAQATLPPADAVQALGSPRWPPWVLVRVCRWPVRWRHSVCKRSAPTARSPSGWCSRRRACGCNRWRRAGCAMPAKPQAGVGTLVYRLPAGEARALPTGEKRAL